MQPKNKFISFINKHDTAIVRVLVMAFYSFALTLFVEWAVRGSISTAFNWVISYPAPFLFTSIFYYFVIFFLFTLIRRIDIPILITSIIACGMGCASYFKNSYRSEPLYPWDFGIISEAADISSEMKIVPTVSMYIIFSIILAFFILLVFLHGLLTRKGFFVKRRPDRKRKIMLVVQPVVSVAVLICYVVFFLNNTALMKSFGITESAFRQAAAAKRNGFTQSFIMNTKYIIPEKPDDYSSSSVSEAVDNIRSSTSTSSVRPNIIFLMSESYADISLCENVTYYDDIFVATNYLKQYHVSGTLLGEQFGGGTCNSEFEVLTGFSMANLPTGCTPYQQYFNGEAISYAAYLKEIGYSTVAIHSYGKQFWNRDVAYPNMGFDKFISEEDFVDPLRRRGLIKDDELVDMIISEYEANKSTGKPFFNFSVSMQNHGGYTNGQYLEDYRVNLSCDELTDEQEGILITYATGIRDANIALDKLISYFQNVDEPTIICMFGDHLGSLGGSDEIYIKSGFLDGSPEDSAENLAQKYTTPFFVWDNYLEQNFVVPQMSFYQLIPSICHWYDLERPKFFDYLLEQQYYCRGNALGLYLDSNGNVSETVPPEAESYLKTHKLFQYDLLFGNKYSLEDIYTSK